MEAIRLGRTAGSSGLGGDLHHYLTPIPGLKALYRVTWSCASDIAVEDSSSSIGEAVAVQENKYSLTPRRHPKC